MKEKINIIQFMPYFPPHKGGVEIVVELIESIKKNKLTYKEIPVDIKYTEYSLSKGQSNGNAIKIAVRFIWSKFFK